MSTPVSEEALAEYQAAFAFYDRDGDGKLTSEEFVEVRVGLVAAMTAPSRSTKVNLNFKHKLLILCKFIQHTGVACSFWRFPALRVRYRKRFRPSRAVYARGRLCALRV